jgi:hypothetical protein
MCLVGTAVLVCDSEVGDIGYQHFEVGTQVPYCMVSHHFCSQRRYSHGLQFRAIIHDVYHGRLVEHLSVTHASHRVLLAARNGDVTGYQHPYC